MMIKAITIAHQCGSGGAELAALVAHKLGWELLDQCLVERVARVADLDSSTVKRFDEVAVRWSGILGARGVVLREICPFVAPRWFEQLNDDSMHALTTELVRAAADFGECVIVASGAQCLLQTRPDVFHVLAYAPIEERATRVHDCYPECADLQAFLGQRDSQTANYILEHYGCDWLDTGLYHLCSNTSMGLDRAATLISSTVGLADKACAPTAEEELVPCQFMGQL
jgi:cytidylate kinase